MLEELCFAMRCHASHQRPALTRHCDRCMTPAAPDMPRGAHEPPALNGSQQVRGDVRTLDRVWSQLLVFFFFLLLVMINTTLFDFFVTGSILFDCRLFDIDCL